jgi:hypothetical protein
MRVPRSERAEIVFETYKDGSFFSHRKVGELFGISESAGRDIILYLRREMPEGYKVVTRAGMGLTDIPGRRPRKGSRPGGHQIIPA